VKRSRGIAGSTGGGARNATDADRKLVSALAKEALAREMLEGAGRFRGVDILSTAGFFS
jgi:hypothetical protein